jgi:uncharacterized membrane protein YbhN (UPF0104 family)
MTDNGKTRARAPIRLWLSRAIMAAGVAWVVVIFVRESADLRVEFAIDSLGWLAYTVAAGCLALLLTVPIFKAMLETHSGQDVSTAYAARLLFVAQILRNLPGRFWGVMYLVNETQDRFAAASMVRANVDFMLYSMAFNLLMATFLLLTVTLDVRLALIVAAAGVALLALTVRMNVVGRLAARFSRLLQARLPRFKGASAAAPRLEWHMAIAVSSLFVAVWLCYLSVWWALPEVFPILRNVNIWLLCASYSLAWVLGYVTMITPGGLGVREAGFFALAAPLMSLPELTFLAVFVRLWQILVESLMFLAFIFVKPPDAARSSNTKAA